MSGTGSSAHDQQDESLRLANELGTKLRGRGWTCATAESCTGGLIGHLVTSIAGSSDYFLGGVIAYSNDAKIRHLGVSPETLDTVGAVSPETAGQMAAGARRALGTDLGISSTGIAGPGGATDRKPVGLIYIGVSTPDRDEVRELRLSGDRLGNINATALAALRLSLDMLQQ
jgi:PncC family amidohydrolase